MSKVYLSLGSNKGNRVFNIQKAVELLAAVDGIDVLYLSSLYETEPWGVKNQNWFINAVVELNVSLLPEELLNHCNLIEASLGRNRNLEKRWGERTIDIDILFYNDEIIEKENLIVPHISLHQRAFVLVPLLELAEHFVHPVYKKTIRQLYQELENPENVVLYGT